jgi:aryl-alcohol dehydrogenase-like predicted oxidoreductase
METRSIGSLKVSTVGLGCNQFGRKIDIDTTRSVIDAALDSGINFLDTSDRYGYGDLPFSHHGASEEFLGECLKGRRDQVVLATKFGNPMGDDPRNRGGGRRWVRIAIEDSLRRLQVDHVDLYQIHRPDPDTPIEETLTVLGELIAEGKVREIGCSNFTAEQLTEAVEVAEKTNLQGFVSVQNEYSMLIRGAEADVLPLCEQYDVAFLPYFPLAAGLLTGKYVAGQPAPSDSRLANFKPNRPHLALDEANLAKAGALGVWAESKGHSLLELAFAWLAAQPAVASVIAGATKPEQIRANAQTASWKLTDEELKEIDQI